MEKQRCEERRREDQRREGARGKKMQVCEAAAGSKSHKVTKHCVFLNDLWLRRVDK